MAEHGWFFDRDGCRPPHPGLPYLRDLQDVERMAALRSGNRAVWLAHEPEALTEVLASMADRHTVARPLTGDHRLLLAVAPTDACRPTLQALFRVVLAPTEGIQLLPLDDLVAVLASPKRSDLLVGGAVNIQDRVAVLFRGNLEALTVPLSWFRPSGDGTLPDPNDFEVTDWGNTVRLGPYEASTHAILYDFDPKYRRRAKQNLVRTDSTFGGALRRLRLSKGLSQEDFAPTLSAKELARIETGKVQKPHKRTLEALAKKLGVAPDEIETY